MDDNGKMVKVGTFNVTSGKLWVADPCYKKDPEIGAVLSNVRNGKWIASIELMPDSMFSRRADLTRVKRLIARSLGGGSAWQIATQECEVLVDSGQMSIQDFDSAPDDPGAFDDEGGHYRAACLRGHHESCNDIPKAFVFTPNGVVSDSGYGDGTYQCAVTKNNEGQIVEVEVDFDPEFDEEFDRDEEEDE